MNRLQYLGVLAAALCGGAICNLVMHQPAAAQGAAKSIEAQELVLKNKDGKVRAKLSVGAEDAALFEVFDAEGKVRLRVGDSGSLYGQQRYGIQMCKGETAYADFSAGIMGDTALRLCDNQGKERVGAGVGLKGDAAFRLTNTDGYSQWVAEAFPDGLVWNRTFAKENAQRIALVLDHEGESSIRLFNEKGEMKFEQKAK